ncbi:MAG: dTMP kinase [Gemmatimonadaceae bacterium]
MSLFVTLDGPGGAGKSTLAALVVQRLAAAGIPAVATREPSDGPLGTAARHQTATFGGTALACLVAADRYHHLATEIHPALAKGAVVVCDRYVPSSYVLQSRDGVPLDYIRQLNRLADRPHLAVLVTATPATLEQRLTVRGVHSRFEHVGSSVTEARMYDELADVFAADGFVMHRISTGDITPQDAAAAIVGRIGQISSRP